MAGIHRPGAGRLAGGRGMTWAEAKDLIEHIQAQGAAIHLMFDRGVTFDAPFKVVAVIDDPMIKTPDGWRKQIKASGETPEAAVQAAHEAWEAAWPEVAA